MTVEYVVLGAILIVMGGVQIWLRHGPGAKALRDEEAALAGRRRDAAPKAAVRSGKAWNSWTAILGGVSVALGIVLVVMGALGR